MTFYRTTISAAVAACVLFSGAAIAQHTSKQKGQGMQQTLQNMPIQALSQAEKDSLRYMREEEKLAHDVYAVLAKQWGNQTQVFDRIGASEARHISAVGRLLQRHNIADPMQNSVQGRFENAKLQKLYDELTARGKTSLVEAFKVGALIEEIDILDLQKDAAKTNQPDIKMVYGNLLRGSEKHLRAFVRNLSQQNVQYQPVHMQIGDYQSIVQASNTKQGMRGKKKGNRHNQASECNHAGGQGKGKGRQGKGRARNMG